MSNTEKQPENTNHEKLEWVEHVTAHNDPNAIGERIRVQRKTLGLSVDGLALLTAKFDYDTTDNDKKGVSTQSLYRYEKGEREPGAREMRLLCYSLNVSPNWLLLGKEWSPSQKNDAALANLVRGVFQHIQVENTLPTGEEWREHEHATKLLEVKSRQS